MTSVGRFNAKTILVENLSCILIFIRENGFHLQLSVLESYTVRQS
jgi:hypothetical protein